MTARARFCLVFTVFGFLSEFTSAQLEYKLINVVFRHGDRTPADNQSEDFPQNPYANSTYAPYGPGQLTNKGKRHAYDLGLRIRKSYDDFLGEIYYPPAILARSTDIDRTKMSLQLVMAGIFPPSSQQQWNPKLNWQPVVMTHVSRSDDVLLISRDCPKFKDEVELILSLGEVQEKISKYEDLMANLTEWTGKSINSPRDAIGIYNYLMALDSLELPLPEWAAGIFPHGSLANLTGLHFEIYSYTRRMNTLNGGILLRNFIDHMSATISQAQTDLKMAIYSAHEVNIAALLGVLGVYEPHMPKYASAIFVELLEDTNQHYVRIFYDLGAPHGRIPINIPFCGVLCPFEKFVQLFRDVLPTDEDLICRKGF